LDQFGGYGPVEGCVGGGSGGRRRANQEAGRNRPKIRGKFGEDQSGHKTLWGGGHGEGCGDYFLTEKCNYNSIIAVADKRKVTLFAAIRKEQYEALRFIAFKENKPLAEITRNAIDFYLKNNLKKYLTDADKYLESLKALL